MANHFFMAKHNSTSKLLTLPARRTPWDVSQRCLRCKSSLDALPPGHSLCRRRCIVPVRLPSPLTYVAIFLCHIRSIHLLHGLSWLRFPSSLPSNTALSNALYLLMWPKNDRFCFLKCLKRWLQKILSLGLTSSLVIFWVQVICSSIQKRFIYLYVHA